MAAELAAADVSGVLAADAEALGTYTPDAFVQAARQIIEQTSPQYVVFPHTYQTRDFVPALAATIDRALVTDVIGDQERQRRGRVCAADVPGQADGRRRRRKAPHRIW